MKMALQTHPVYQADRISHEALAAVSQGENESIEDDVYSLNEDLMINSITEHGQHPYRYGIASVNFKGNLRGSRGAGNAKLRKLLLGQLHGQTYSSIVFVQECPWKDPVNHLQLKKTFRYTGVVNESGVIWNSDLFEVKRLDSYRLIGDKYQKLMQHRARLCICEVTLLDQPVTADNNVALEKTPNVSDFIAISWHGPHKCADKEKRLVLRDLLEFVMYIKNKNGPKACVIGGDFNFSIENAYEDLDSYVGLAIADSYELETIDYFIFTSDLINILHAKQLSLEYDAASIYTAQDIDRARAEECKADPDDVIDHKPVFAVLDLGSPNPFSSQCKLTTRPPDKPQVQRLPPPAADIPASTAPSSGATGVPRATITKTPNVVRPGGSGQNHSAGRISPEGSQVLSKRRLQDLVREIDSTEQLDDDDDVEELLLQVADDFIENVVTSSCQLAKHRKSNTLETKDVQMYLERNWNMYIPGFGTDDIRPYQKACTTEAHKQRMALIRKTLKK